MEVTLVDAGPLVALLNRTDQHHDRCVAAVGDIFGSLRTTWPVLTEAMHFLGSRVGWHGQEALWGLVKRGELSVEPGDGAALQRCAELMAEYRDTPMDLADASLVALAESCGRGRLFTLDSAFRFYRLRGGRILEIIP